MKMNMNMGIYIGFYRNQKIRISNRKLFLIIIYQNYEATKKKHDFKLKCFYITTTPG